MTVSGGLVATLPMVCDRRGVPSTAFPHALRALASGVVDTRDFPFLPQAPKLVVL
jgi:hypothetical protein